MTTTLTPEIIPLHLCSDPRAGGKAFHLAKLVESTLRVPEGFVILGASPDSFPDGLDEAYARVRGRVAVRSSAIGEDSVDASFAGQYDTYLGIEGIDAVKDAVMRCLQSVRGARAEAYRDAVNAQANGSMSVIVQRMVEARAAGVLFTRNPITGADDEIVIEATQGLGEALVSGHVAAHRILLSREGAVLSNDTQGLPPSIDIDVAEKLLRDALVAERHFGFALDMEWALDADGTIQWLQARPITTTNLPGLDELDSPIDETKKSMFTTYNVGEVLPGAATPLGGGFVLEGFNSSMSKLFRYFGVPAEQLENVPMAVQVSGHIFLHLNAMYLSGLYVLGASKEGLDYSLAGHPLENVELPPLASFPVRLRNAVTYFSYLSRARKTLDAFLERTASFELPHADDPAEIYKHICDAVPLAYEALSVHLHTSSLSGALQEVVLGILADGARPTIEHQALYSSLLAFVNPEDPDASTSSLGLAQAMDRLVRTIVAHPADAEKIATLSVDDALVWMRGDECAASIRLAFEGFLQEHGHRCVREIELRQADWREEPRPLVSNLQAILATSQGALPERDRRVVELPPMHWPKRWMAQKFVTAARNALVLRERSKSHTVRIVRKIRPAYLRIAQKLVDAKSLPDTDLLFFFTHQEVGRFINNPDPALVRRALHRRRLHPQKMSLEFPRVCVGKPKPIQEESVPSDDADIMHGTPVSRGVIVGLARVARSPEEAKAIEPGEILVVPYTDVGWAPYFLRAAGLASEIGGTLSHGAVVARECGLPAIVNLPGATKRFRTGDKLRLNGDTGELTLLARATATS